MKQKFTSLAVFSLLLSANLYAQSSFNVQFDTVSFSIPAGVSETIEDEISATTGTVTVVWKVTASDFPADWVPAYCLCDNSFCYPGTTLWTPSGGTHAVETSHPYDTAWGNFDMLIDFTDTSSIGCHYMTVRMDNQAIPSDIRYETFLICNTPTSVSSINKYNNDIVLYPNPAQNELNVVYDTHYGIRNINLSDIAGQTIAHYKVSANSAHLHLDNIPPGVYFLRLMNSTGETIVTRKFQKE